MAVEFLDYLSFAESVFAQLLDTPRVVPGDIDARATTDRTFFLRSGQAGLGTVREFDGIDFSQR